MGKKHRFDYGWHRAIERATPTPGGPAIKVTREPPGRLEQTTVIVDPFKLDLNGPGHRKGTKPSRPQSIGKVGEIVWRADGWGTQQITLLSPSTTYDEYRLQRGVVKVWRRIDGPQVSVPYAVAVDSFLTVAAARAYIARQTGKAAPGDAEARTDWIRAFFDYHRAFWEFVKAEQASVEGKRHALDVMTERLQARGQMIRKAEQIRLKWFKAIGQEGSI